MNNLFSLENPLMRFLARVFDMIVTNALFLICCVPVVTAGAAIAALNKGLEAVKCNVLVASHDHQLIQTVCNRVFDFTPDGKLIDRMMTYDEYLESQKAE